LDSSSETRLKICDFGITRDVTVSPMTLGHGTPAFMSPELFPDRVDERGNYNNKVDVYAFAMILWQMFALDTPFGEFNQWAIMSAVKGGKRPEIATTTPPRLAALIEKCWHQESEKRPGFEEILEELLRP